MSVVKKKNIFVFLYPQDNEYVLKDEKFTVEKGNSDALAAPIGKFGLYMAVTIKRGVLVLWDQKNSVFIKLSSQYSVNTNIFTGFQQNVKT